MECCTSFSTSAGPLPGHSHSVPLGSPLGLRVPCVPPRSPPPPQSPSRCPPSTPLTHPPPAASSPTHSTSSCPCRLSPCCPSHGRTRPPSAENPLPCGRPPPPLSPASCLQAFPSFSSSRRPSPPSPSHAASPVSSQSPPLPSSSPPPDSPPPPHPPPPSSSCRPPFLPSKSFSSLTSSRGPSARAMRTMPCKSALHRSPSSVHPPCCLCCPLLPSPSCAGALPPPPVRRSCINLCPPPRPPPPCTQSRPPSPGPCSSASWSSPVATSSLSARTGVDPPSTSSCNPSASSFPCSPFLPCSVSSGSSLDFVGLISGGKDSIYSIHVALSLGHRLVAVASLRPPPQVIEADSFMFQSIGTELVEDVAECLQVPLVVATVKGKPVATSSLDYEQTEGDEVEDLTDLLRQVKRRFPSVSAVSAGAILSDYQRLRIEHVCSRLELVPMFFLWHREQEKLLREMAVWGLDAVVVKTAAWGLGRQHLGKTIGQLAPQLKQLDKEIGLHQCGEGGEYETLVVDCPRFEREAIFVDKWRLVVHCDDAYAPVLLLQACKWHRGPKAPPLCASSSFSSASSSSSSLSPNTVTQEDKQIPLREEERERETGHREDNRKQRGGQSATGTRHHDLGGNATYLTAAEAAAQATARALKETHEESEGETNQGESRQLRRAYVQEKHSARLRDGDSCLNAGTTHRPGSDSFKAPTWRADLPMCSSAHSPLSFPCSSSCSSLAFSSSACHRRPCQSCSRLRDLVTLRFYASAQVRRTASKLAMIYSRILSSSDFSLFGGRGDELRVKEEEVTGRHTSSMLHADRDKKPMGFCGVRYGQGRFEGETAGAALGSASSPHSRDHPPSSPPPLAPLRRTVCPCSSPLPQAYPRLSLTVDEGNAAGYVRDCESREERETNEDSGVFVVKGRKLGRRLFVDVYWSAIAGCTQEISTSFSRYSPTSPSSSLSSSPHPKFEPLPEKLCLSGVFLMVVKTLRLLLSTEENQENQLCPIGHILLLVASPREEETAQLLLSALAQVAANPYTVTSLGMPPSSFSEDGLLFRLLIDTAAKEEDATGRRETGDGGTDREGDDRTGQRPLEPQEAVERRSYNLATSFLTSTVSSSGFSVQPWDNPLSSACSLSSSSTVTKLTLQKSFGTRSMNLWVPAIDVVPRPSPGSRLTDSVESVQVSPQAVCLRSRSTETSPVVPPSSSSSLSCSSSPTRCCQVLQCARRCTRISRAHVGERALALFEEREGNGQRAVLKDAPSSRAAPYLGQNKDTQNDQELLAGDRNEHDAARSGGNQRGTLAPVCGSSSSSPPPLHACASHCWAPSAVGDVPEAQTVEVSSRDVFLVGGVPGRIPHSNLLPGSGFSLRLSRERTEVSSVVNKKDQWETDRDETGEKADTRPTSSLADRRERRTEGLATPSAFALEVLLASRNLQQTLRLAGAPTFRLPEGGQEDEEEESDEERDEGGDGGSEDREHEEEEDDGDPEQVASSCYPPPLVFAFVSVPLGYDAARSPPVLSSVSSAPPPLSSSLARQPTATLPPSLSSQQVTEGEAENEEREDVAADPKECTTVRRQTLEGETQGPGGRRRAVASSEDQRSIGREEDFHRQAFPRYGNATTTESRSEGSCGRLLSAVRMQIQTHLSTEILMAKDNSKDSQARKARETKSSGDHADKAAREKINFLHSPHRLFASRFLSLASPIRPVVDAVPPPHPAPCEAYAPSTSRLPTSLSTPVGPRGDRGCFPSSSSPPPPPSIQRLSCSRSSACIWSAGCACSGGEDDSLLPSTLVVPVLVESVQGGGHVSLWPLGVLGLKRYHTERYGEEEQRSVLERTGLRAGKDKETEPCKRSTTAQTIAGLPWPFADANSSSSHPGGHEPVELQQENSEKEQNVTERTRQEATLASWVILPAAGRARGYCCRAITTPWARSWPRDEEEEEKDLRREDRKTKERAETKEKEDTEEQKRASREERKEAREENREQEATEEVSGEWQMDQNGTAIMTEEENVEKKRTTTAARALGKPSRGNRRCFFVSTEVTAQLGEEMMTVSPSLPTSLEDERRRIADWAAAVITVGALRPSNLPGLRTVEDGGVCEEEEEDRGGYRAKKGDVEENSEETDGHIVKGKGVQQHEPLKSPTGQRKHEQGQRKDDEEAIGVLVEAVIDALAVLRRCTGSQEAEDGDCCLYVLYLSSEACLMDRNHLAEKHAPLSELLPFVSPSPTSSASSLRSTEPRPMPSSHVAACRRKNSGGQTWEKSFLACLRRALARAGGKAAVEQGRRAPESSLPSYSPRCARSPPSRSPAATHLLCNEMAWRDDQEGQPPLPVLFLPVLGLEGDDTCAQAVLTYGGGSTAASTGPFPNEV